MLHQNHMPGCLPCQNGAAKNPQTRWRRQGTCAPPFNRHRQLTPEPTPEPTPQPTPHPPGSPPTSTGNTFGAQSLVIIDLPAGYADSQTPIPCGESFSLDTSAQDSEHDTDFDPYMLPDEGTSTS